MSSDMKECAGTYLDSDLMNETISTLRLALPRWTLGGHLGQVSFGLTSVPSLTRSRSYRARQ
jgi:hypothetical protein